MGVVTKRSSMIFYSDPTCHYSHRVRIVLAEKDVTVDIEQVEGKVPQEVSELNPYNSLPTLIDRELALFETKVMMEYLDERFPHPPLLPVYPVARAQSRLWIHRIEKDWGPLIETIRFGSEKDAAKARKELTDSLVAINPIFTEMPFFMSEEFTLVDCCVAPILWRLPAVGVELPEKECELLLNYADRLFERESFQASLSDAERGLRLRA